MFHYINCSKFVLDNNLQCQKDNKKADFDKTKKVYENLLLRYIKIALKKYDGKNLNTTLIVISLNKTHFMGRSRTYEYFVKLKKKKTDSITLQKKQLIYICVTNMSLCIISFKYFMM